MTQYTVVYKWLWSNGNKTICTWSTQHESNFDTYMNMLDRNKIRVSDLTVTKTEK